MKFEVFHHACDKSGRVRYVVANGFFMFPIDLQGLSSQLQFDYQFVCAKRREVERDREKERERENEPHAKSSGTSILFGELQHSLGVPERK